MTMNLVLRFPTAKGKGDLTFQRKTERDLGTRLRDSQQTVRTTNAAVFQTHSFSIQCTHKFQGPIPHSPNRSPSHTDTLKGVMNGLCEHLRAQAEIKNWPCEQLKNNNNNSRDH